MDDFTQDWENHNEKMASYLDVPFGFESDVHRYSRSELWDTFEVRSDEQLEDAARQAVVSLGYDVTQKRIGIAKKIMSEYVVFLEENVKETKKKTMKKIQESIGSLLKPKTRDSIKALLDEMSLEKKVDMFFSQDLNGFDLILMLVEAGADATLLVPDLVKRCDRDDLEEFVTEVIGYHTRMDDPFEDFVTICVDALPDAEIKEVIFDFFEGLGDEEAADLLADLMIKNYDDILSAQEPYEDDDEWEIDDDDY